MFWECFWVLCTIQECVRTEQAKITSSLLEFSNGQGSGNQVIAVLDKDIGSALQCCLHTSHTQVPVLQRTEAFNKK